MKLLVAPDSAMTRTPDGKYWCPTIYEYSFFERYLQVFDSIVVVSRVKHADYDEVAGFLRCDGPSMTVAELPDMHGAADYFKKLISFLACARASTAHVDCAVVRLPSIPASAVLRYIKRKRIKHALEIVVDPEDAYADHAFASRYFSRLLRKQCREADGVSYVTGEYLQRKYPSSVRLFGEDGRHFESSYSTIRLSDDYFGEARTFTGKSSFTIIHTANNMNNDVKGHEVLLQAAAIALEKGFDIRVRFVGDGTLRKHFEESAEKLGLKNRTVFVGRLSSADAVRDELLRADLLVFPTKAEGLPRTIIEAMAVGLPCISTPVAGIPELLEPEDMIGPTDVEGFADRIMALISDPEQMEQKSVRNIQKAKAYSDTLLQERRNAFYRNLRHLAEGKGENKT